MERLPEIPPAPAAARIGRWLALFGPGAVIASLTIGTGELIFSSRAGALFGLDVLWLFLLTCVLKGILLYGAARHMVLSGTHPFEALVVVPCSGTTLAKIASGIADNLVTRAAAVALKERRTLILVPRETPLSPIALEAMLKLANLGVVILPAMPGFYGRPETVDDLVDFVVARILDHLGVPHALGPRWTGPAPP